MILSVDVGRKNLALCGLEAGSCPRGSLDRVRHWAVVSCEPTPAGLAHVLDGLSWCATCGDVVIERQPNKNATMTRLQHYLEMYFAVRGTRVTVQDAKHKLAFAASTPWWPAAMPDNWSYATRKKLSVQTVDAFLKNTEQDDAHMHAFATTTKKDDLADALLQGMAYAHNLRPLELARGAAPPPIVKARKPTAAQVASGKKYSKSAIVYLLRGVSDLSAALAADKRLARSVNAEFGGLDAPDLLRSLGRL